MAVQQADRFTDLPSRFIVEKLRHYLDLTAKIIDQTERRVLRGEQVPADDDGFQVLPIENPIRVATKWILCGRSWRMVAEESERVANLPN